MNAAILHSRVSARAILILLATLVLVSLLFTFIFHARIETGPFIRSHPVLFSRTFDLRLRYNEIQCLRSGIDPFTVWSGERSSQRYYRYDRPAPSPDAEPIHAYAPWVYTYLYPLATLPWPLAVSIFYMIEVLAALTLAAFAFRTGWGIAHRTGDAILCMAAPFLVGFPYEVCLYFGNFGIIVTALILLMVFFLNRGREVAAGICWALIMSKPQLGLLLSIPLLIQRKYLTILTAVLICVAASLWPAWLCRSSPLSLILCLGEAGKPYVWTTLLIPGPLFTLLSRWIGTGLTALASAVAGISLCTLLAWRTRHAGRWEWLMMPALLFATAWSYGHCHDRCVWGLIELFWVVMLIRTEGWRRRLPLVLLILLFAHESLMVIQPAFPFTWFQEVTAVTAAGGFHLLLSGLFFLLPGLSVLAGAAWCWLNAGVGTERGQAG